MIFFGSPDCLLIAYLVFSTKVSRQRPEKLIIGEFLRPSGETDDITGEEKYVRLNEDQMKDEIDKVRKENGWKPRKRIGPLRSRDDGRRSNGDRGDVHNVEDQYKLLQRLQVNITLRARIFLKDRTREIEYSSKRDC